MGFKKLGAIIIALILFACIAYAADNQEKKYILFPFSMEQAKILWQNTAK